MKMLVLSVAALFAIGACGGQKKDPKNPKNVAGGGGGAGAGDPLNPPPKKPKRKLSADAKKSFASVAAKYEQAKTAGTVKNNCSSLASSFTDVYNEHPKLVEAKFNAGVIWEACGKDTKAESIYKELLQKHPNHGPALNNLGQIYYRRGNASAAETHWRKAAAAKNSEGYANLALLQRLRALKGDMGALREAVNNIHRALAVDSFNIEAYNMLATLLYDHARSKSQLTMARLICVQASKKEPKFAPIYNLLGLIHLKMGNVTPALAQFRKAAGLKPDFVEAQMNIGSITLSFRDYKSSEEAFRKVLSLPVSKDIKYAATVGLGVALRGQRNYEGAMKQYQAAEKLNPSNGDIAYNKGILVQDYMFNAGKPEEGIAQLQRAKDLLNKYLSSGQDKSAVKDARRRIKNIDQLVKAIRQQQQMQRQMKAMQAKQAAQDAADKKAAKKKAPAKKK
ncbi:MAG: tetratricopeptide repeat protein [Myxococcales bacterium]|nr:tetratricopeptide repeat protein [Myxococcales bacterium]